MEAPSQSGKNKQMLIRTAKALSNRIKPAVAHDTI
jgi:hypothetical protein